MTDTTTERVPAVTYKVRKARHPIIAFALQQPLGALGFLVIIVMMLCGLFAEFVAPYDPLAIDYMAILQAPSAEHWIGGLVDPSRFSVALQAPARALRPASSPPSSAS